MALGPAETPLQGRFPSKQNWAVSMAGEDRLSTSDRE